MTAPIINNYYSNYWENVHFERNARSKDVNSNKESNSPKEHSKVSDVVNAGGITSGLISGGLDAVSQSTKFVNEASPNVKNMVGKGKIVSTALGHGFNALGGIISGKEIASKHANGDEKHDTTVKAGAILGGITGSVGVGWLGGVAGAKAGAAIGTVICPGIGTAVGGVLGGVLGGYLGASYGGSYGAEFGADIGENVHKSQQNKQFKQQIGLTPDVNMAQTFNAMPW